MAEHRRSETRGLAERWLTWFESAAKFVGAAVVLIAAASFVVPPTGTLVNIVTASRFGVVGHVYYEVAKRHEIVEGRRRKKIQAMRNGGNFLTEDGQLWLLVAGGGDDYPSIRRGDRLQAASDVAFHEKKKRRSRVIFNLSRGDCVIVLRADSPFPVKQARSGGWLKVATTACGLFG